MAGSPTIFPVAKEGPFVARFVTVQVARGPRRRRRPRASARPIDSATPTDPSAPATPAAGRRADRAHPLGAPGAPSPPSIGIDETAASPADGAAIGPGAAPSASAM